VSMRGMKSGKLSVRRVGNGGGGRNGRYHESVFCSQRHTRDLPVIPERIIELVTPSPAPIAENSLSTFLGPGSLPWSTWAVRLNILSRACPSHTHHAQISPTLASRHLEASLEGWSTRIRPYA
jgi:hypothetical protein